MEIFYNEKKSLHSQLNTSKLDVSIKQTSDELQYIDLYERLDLNQTYKEESDNCHKYRLVVTIRPYCTNVLFNPLTEIVYYGEGGVKAITDDVTNNVPKGISGDVYGKRNGLDRVYMLDNTEYSSDAIGYKYYIGYDFLNNHILRNKTFKSVTLPENRSSEQVFNTIEDVMRDKKGKNVLFTNRFNVNEVQVNLPKKLYDNEDLLEYSTNEVHDNLISVEDGWYGVINKGHVPHKELDSGSNFSLPLNNYPNCSFIDFQPGRNCFSFSPILNKNKNRFEENWKMLLTYPHREDYENKVIYKNGLNSLPITSVSLSRVDSGELFLYITTSIKNNVKSGDLFDLYILDNGTFEGIGYDLVSSSDSTINNVFICSDMNFLYSILKITNINNVSNTDIEKYNDILSHIEFRMVRKTGYNQRVKYYAQMLRPIPNLEYKKEEYNTGVDIERYIKENCLDKDGNLYDFNRSMYDLAYAKTIYNDNITQCTITDDIDLSYLLDDKFDSIYVTFIKNNKGYKEWYYDYDYNNDNIERSRLFGKVIDCLYSDTDVEEVKRLDRNYDYRLVNGLGLYQSSSISDEEIKYDRGIKSEYIHSICEIDESTQTITILSDVMYRFNTAQRELGNDRNKTGKYVNCYFSDIIRDDKDFNGFALEKDNLGQRSYLVDGRRLSFLDRPEGYYYSPHYRIQLKNRLKTFGKYISKEVQLISFEKKNNKEITIKSKLYYKLLVGDYLEVKTNAGTEICKIKSVVNKVNITFEVSDNIFNSFDSDTKIYMYPSDLPKYATRIDEYTYTYPLFEPTNNPSVTYKNKRKYVNLDINFFLKRQDPEGFNGLYIKQSFGDIEGHPFDRNGMTNRIFELPDGNCGVMADNLLESAKEELIRVGTNIVSKGVKDLKKFLNKNKSK